MSVFLSYAEEDEHVANEVVRTLRETGVEVFFWQAPEARGGRFIAAITAELNRADAFLALVSPSALRSQWCTREHEAALQREHDLQRDDPGRKFIYVLRIATTPFQDAGFLRGYDWFDWADARRRPRDLAVLIDKLRAAGGAALATAVATPTDLGPRQDQEEGALVFRNRTHELDKVLRSLTTPGGHLFWLVIAPPGLGKTWFLQLLTRELAGHESPAWVARYVDLRHQPPDLHGDPARLLASLFGIAPQASVTVTTLREIARSILHSRKSYLCLLDSAQLLESDAADALRGWLSEIHRRVQEAHDPNTRLAVVVASRRENEWRGLYPPPRLSSLPLTEFKQDVVRLALEDLATEMGRKFPGTVFQQNAERVYRLSEGLPALLVGCIEWIRREEWQDLDRLEEQERFEEIAKPYVEGLFSLENLFPLSGRRLDEQRDVLWEAFRLLAPYRLFTQSHLRHHLALDDPFRRALEMLGWTAGDLWEAIRGTALLYRPMQEVWQEIYPPIRRLLYRYHYQSADQRAQAHREARKFIEVWAGSQVGKEQVKGLVECLFHEAVGLWTTQPAEPERELLASVAKLSRGLKPSPAYTVGELRSFAAESIRNDEDLQAVLSEVPRLLDQLARAVAVPQEPPT